MERNIPTLFMMVGLPGSGKTTIAKEHLYGVTGDRYSSDDLRKELFGDTEYNKNNNTLLFTELHRRIKTNLLCGNDSIYDATNINKKRRIAFLRELTKIPCQKICVIVATPYDDCLKNNQNRIVNGDAGVPDETITRMYTNWEPPHKSEGWDKIRIVGNGVIHDMIQDMLNIWMPYDQCNSHHRLTLGAHMMFARDLVCQKIKIESQEAKNLRVAAFLHDIGKPFTKSYINKNGEEDTDAHYYNHHNVGSYEAMFYVLDDLEDREFLIEDDKWIEVDTDVVLDICNLIYYHMHPYMSWKQSKAAQEKDKRLLGDEMFNRIMLLHEADQLAH